jgi:hypothetical protein
MFELVGLGDVRVGPAVDTFGGARGEERAGLHVRGYAFLARRPQ